MLEEYIKKTESEYYPPVENLLDLIYEHYTENNPVEKNTAARKVAKAKEKELEEWLRSDCGRRCVPRYQPCRSAGTGKTVKRQKKNPTHQALSRCCPKTTTAIHNYGIPHGEKLCKRF